MVFADGVGGFAMVTAGAAVSTVVLLAVVAPVLPARSVVRAAAVKALPFQYWPFVDPLVDLMVSCVFWTPLPPGLSLAGTRLALARTLPQGSAVRDQVPATNAH